MEVLSSLAHRGLTGASRGSRVLRRRSWASEMPRGGKVLCTPGKCASTESNAGASQSWSHSAAYLQDRRPEPAQCKLLHQRLAKEGGEKQDAGRTNTLLRLLSACWPRWPTVGCLSWRNWVMFHFAPGYAGEWVRWGMEGGKLAFYSSWSESFFKLKWHA